MQDEGVALPVIIHFSTNFFDKKSGAVWPREIHFATVNLGKFWDGYLIKF